MIALACVAMMESPMAYHGMVFARQQELIDVAGPAPAPQSVGDQEDQPAGEDRPVGAEPHGVAEKSER